MTTSEPFLRMVKLALHNGSNAQRARQAGPSSCDFYSVPVAHRAAKSLPPPSLRRSERGVMEEMGVVVDACKKEQFVPVHGVTAHQRCVNPLCENAVRRPACATDRRFNLCRGPVPRRSPPSLPLGERDRGGRVSLHPYSPRSSFARFLQRSCRIVQPYEYMIHDT